MSDFIDRVTKQIFRSVNDPDYPAADYAKFPDRMATQVAELIPRQYRVIQADDSVRAMSAAEKNAAIATWRSQHKAALKAAVNAYGESRYSQADEMRLKHAYNRAKHEGLTNRAAYVKAVLEWEDALFIDYAGRIGAVDAAATHDDVFAVSLDFSNNDATDPLVSVAVAKSIAD